MMWNLLQINQEIPSPMAIKFSTPQYKFNKSLILQTDQLRIHFLVRKILLPHLVERVDAFKTRCWAQLVYEMNLIYQFWNKRRDLPPRLVM